MATAPESMVCLECETPCYVFEWKGDKIIEILCEVCGNEDPEAFMTQDDMDAMLSAE